MQLNQDQLGFFKDNGYLRLQGMLDLEQCALARDRMWATLPDGFRMRRDDPTTHIGPFRENETRDDPMHMRTGFRWQVREFGTEPLLINLVFTTKLRAVAEQLLGEGTLRAPTIGGMPMGSKGTAWPGGPVDPAINQGARGIYNTLPYGSRERERDYAHTDGHPFQLGLVGLIHDVPADGGSFKVWPRSHRRLYPTFQMQYDQPRIPFYDHMPKNRGIIHSQAYLDELQAIVEDTPPVDCWGSAGDVVLWHHRTAHMAGHNYSNVIRQAVLYDFVKTDLDECRTMPPHDDMWHDWSGQLQATSSEYSDELAGTQMR